MQVERTVVGLVGFGWLVATVSGERVSNTSVTYPGEGDNRWKRRLIPHVLCHSVGRVKVQLAERRLCRFGMGRRPISSLVG